MTKQRYKKIEKGIRKNNSNKKYCVYGMVKGVKIPEKEFLSLKEAREFRKRFIASIELSEPKKRQAGDDFLFKDVFLAYKSKCIDSCTVASTRQNRLDKIPFLEGLFPYKMSEFDPDLIEEHLLNEKRKCLDKAFEIKERVESKDPGKSKLNLPVENYSKRSNFNDDLKLLNAIFNWYREKYRDTNFGNPILKSHKTTGTNKGPGFIKYPPAKEKRMTIEEIVAFWKGFEPKFSVYHDLAVFQFFLLNRIQEPCGMQLEDVSIKFRKAWVKNVCIWGRDKKFLELKPVPKNNQPEPMFLNDELLEIVKRRLNATEAGCNFLFQLNGEPLGYRSIQYQYNKALKAAGLFPRFSATHFNRYSGGTAIRALLGLDHAQASGRWKDSKTAQGYCSVDFGLQKESTETLHDYFKEQNYL